MSGIYIRFTAPKSGKASAANINYITRQNASGADEHAINLHNLDELKGEDYRETTTNLKAFAEMRLNDEATRTKRGAGEARTHYRAILSFDRQENTIKAGELAKEWLKQNFPDARACAVVHQNTKNTHIHLWVDCRKIDDRKIHTDNKTFKNLDTTWAKIYAKEYGEHYLKDHIDKKQESKKFKQDYRKAKAEGKTTPAAPPRQRQNKIQSSKQQERTSYGFTKQSGTRDDQRAIAVRPIARRRREQDISRAVSANDGAARAANQAARDANNTLQGIKGTRSSVEHARSAGQRGDAAVGAGKRDLSETVRTIEETRQKVNDLGREHKIKDR
jgi:hypothetical protein